MARYVAYRGLEKVEIEADSVGLITDDGTEVELHFRKSDNEISVSTNGTMEIHPRAANVVRIGREK